MTLAEKMCKVGTRVANELGATRCPPFVVLEVGPARRIPFPAGCSEADDLRWQEDVDPYNCGIGGAMDRALRRR